MRLVRGIICIGLELAHCNVKLWVHAFDEIMEILDFIFIGCLN